MTRRGIATVLSSLLVALSIAVNAPAVGADPPCITDEAGNCAAAAGRDVTTQQIVAVDALSATTPGVAAASGGQMQYDQIRTALEMASAAATAPIAAALSGPTGGSYAAMATSSMGN